MNPPYHPSFLPQQLNFSPWVDINNQRLERHEYEQFGGGPRKRRSATPAEQTMSRLRTKPSPKDSPYVGRLKSRRLPEVLQNDQLHVIDNSAPSATSTPSQSPRSPGDHIEDTDYTMPTATPPSPESNQPPLTINEDTSKSVGRRTRKANADLAAAVDRLDKEVENIAIEVGQPRPAIIDAWQKAIGRGGVQDNIWNCYQSYFTANEEQELARLPQDVRITVDDTSKHLNISQGKICTCSYSTLRTHYSRYPLAMLRRVSERRSQLQGSP